MYDDIDIEYEKEYDCFSEGMAGNCGLDCRAYKQGKCENHLEAIPNLKTDEDKEIYMDNYGDFLYNYGVKE